MNRYRSHERTISLPYRGAKLHYAPTDRAWRTLCGLEYDRDWIYRGTGCADCKTCVRADEARNGGAR